MKGGRDSGRKVAAEGKRGKQERINKREKESREGAPRSEKTK